MKPYIIINAAMSADGKISTIERKQFKISGVDDFKRVDSLKSDVDAIMVGINTVISDNPSLTIKFETNISKRKIKYKSINPIRIVVDSHARISLDADILNKGVGERIIIVSNCANKEKVHILKQSFKVIICGEESVNLIEAMKKLYEFGIKSILVEGGATLNFSLIRDRLVDEIYTYIGNLIIGGRTSPTLVDGLGFKEKETISLSLINYFIIDNGIFLQWKVNNN